MTILSWNKQYLIGDWVIDDEHKGLFDLVNEFHTHWIEQRRPQEIAGILNKLMQYSEQHFSHEEEIMAGVDYPKLAHHQQEHEKLVQTIFKLNEEFAQRGSLAAQDVQLFCKHWLVDHIVYSDFDFRDFLVQKQK